jgi:electron transfer flavoprotein alpha subunit
MKIVVCVKQKTDGELNPFDACAYEAALRISGAEVVLLSMAPEKSKEMLLNLTRLGAKEAYLLCDKAFAGSDTLATSYTLSLAIKKLQPDMVICGRQTVDGDTGQVGPGLSEYLCFNLITNVMEIVDTAPELKCINRAGECVKKKFPCLITVERINDLRKPSIRSTKGTVTVWNAEQIGADVKKCGISGSPTQVVNCFENNSDKRKCTFITKEQLISIVEESVQKEKSVISSSICDARIKKMWVIGEKPMEYAKTVSDDITVVPLDTPQKIAERIMNERPSCVLWDSSLESKEVSAQVAVILQTGLCADCTKLETDGESLFMYRPAFSGNVIAKIKCTTMPQMATVRTKEQNANKIMVAIGKGAGNSMETVNSLAEKLNAEIVASRGAVDSDMATYPMQVGLTGRSVSPNVYIAIGISGAVHHIAGMKSAGTIIAINKDKNAPIFEYSDYGIVADIDEIGDIL